jgi:hypothetical protein
MNKKKKELSEKRFLYSRPPGFVALLHITALACYYS